MIVPYQPAWNFQLVPDTLMTQEDKKPSILLIGSQMTTGGSQNILLILSRWLYQNGYPIKLAFFHDEDGLHEKWQQASQFQIINLKAWEKNPSSIRKYFMLLAGLSRLNALMRREKPDAVMTFTHHSNLLGIPIAWLQGIPIRIAAHRGKIHGFPRWQEIIHSWMINSGMATLLVAISGKIRDDAIHEGVHPEKILVIPNGVEAIDVNQAERETKRSELGLAPGQPAVLSVGRLSYEKGHDILIQAIPAVLEKHPDVHFLFAGDGPQRAKLENLVDALNIRQNVRFLGVRGDVRQLVAAADVFVFPSRSEGLGQALLEAMSVGIAVAASNVGGIPEVVEDGKSGLLSKPEQPVEFARAIIRLLDNPQERDRFRENARLRVLERYPIQEMYSSYSKILNPDGSGSKDG